MERDPSSDQLNEYKKKIKTPPLLLTGSGNPVPKVAILTAGPQGPILLQDTVFLDSFRHADRERIPERVVHAKGAGAFGYFEVTHDITKYSKALVFSTIGKKTPIAVRFSVVRGGNDTPDTIRLHRGFAVKFYTEQGIWDLVGNNTPLFFIKDPILGTGFVHSQERNPVTYLRDVDMFWDFVSLRKEATHQIMFHFSDRGIPDGYRHMNGYGANTFKLVNDMNESFYCKFHFKTDQGIKNLLPEKAVKLSVSEPHYATKDLYDSIARGENPSWTFYIQIMTLSQAEKFKFNPFDVTKVWPKAEYPLIPVGKLVLNKNPTNYFTDVEQAAFNPANMPPGIEVSPDKILQGRIFAYGDAQRYRLGSNHLQLPINCPFKMLSVMNYQRDGFMAVNNQGRGPNYYPNSFKGPEEDKSVRQPSYYVSGDVARHETVDEDDFSQAGDFWRVVLNADQKTSLVRNIADDLKKASVFIVERALANFINVDIELGRRLIDELRKSGVQINASGKSASL